MEKKMLMLLYDLNSTVTNGRKADREMRHHKPFKVSMQGLKLRHTYTQKKKTHSFGYVTITVLTPSNSS